MRRQSPAGSSRRGSRGWNARRRAIRVRIAGEERIAAVEDAGRLRDALGVPLPVGVPEVFLEPVDDPLADLVRRYARTHGPFTTADVAARFGLGPAVAAQTLARLAARGGIVQGEFRPGAMGSEWCDADVLRRLRRRSLAALRKELEPVPAVALARFLPAWQHVGGRLRGVDGVLRVVEQLQASAVPASALDGLVLSSRVAGYQPALLDQLTSSGEVLWAGQGQLPGTDGWISLHLADSAALTLPEPDAAAIATPLHQAVLAALDGGGALFFRALSDRLGSLDDTALTEAVWDLVWGGWLTNDTLSPVRTLLASGRGAHRPGGARRAPRTRYARPGRPSMPSRSGPPSMAGRWSRLPAVDPDPTRRAHTAAEALLDRHGVVTRGAVVAERLPGGFAAAYKVLSAFEDVGRTRRGYVVEGLGAAQFAVPGAVDRLRAQVGDRRTPVPAVVLAATDPANPFGAALPWPARDEGPGHRAGRKAGALVVLVDGELVLYVERGGKSLLSYVDDPDRLQPATDALALAVRDGALGRLTVERADGARVTDSPLGRALEASGFHPTPRGLRIRA